LNLLRLFVNEPFLFLAKHQGLTAQV
jgi:hypothetical protein